MNNPELSSMANSIVNIPPSVLHEAGWHEKMYNLLLQNLPFSLILIDPSLCVISEKWHADQNFGRPEGCAVGMRLRDLMPDDGLEISQLETAITKLFDKGVVIPSALMTYRQPKMPLRIYLYTLIPVKSGDSIENVMLVLDDVTEKLRVSAKARMDLRYLEGVIESGNDLVIVTDFNGMITSWNANAERISGYSLKDVQGRMSSDFWETTQSESSQIRELVTSGTVTFLELNLVTRSGLRIPVKWLFSSIRDDFGMVNGFVAVGKDLSESRALEEHLRQSEKLAALGVMAGGIAHELRNPLAVSYSAAQFLLEPEIDAVFQQACVKKIVDGIERSSVIIENLLRFARPSTIDQIESVNLVNLARDTVSFLTPQAKLTKINFLEVYEDPPVFVLGNESLLRQVMMNLILNAAQSMPTGGDVIVSMLKEHDEAVFSVRDAGCGIAPALMAKLFDPFFTTRPVGQGTGLGLSISHTIVAQLKGTINVEFSEVGVGSLFVVRLPLLAQVT